MLNKTERELKVNKVLDLVRYWWIEAQLQAPPFVQQVVIPRMHEAKEIVHLLGKPYLPIYQLQGQAQGGPLMVTYIGLDYTKPFLTHLLFAGEPVEQRVGQIPFWHYQKLENSFSGDMIIVEAAKHLIRELPCENAIVFPTHVDHALDVRGDWQNIRSRFHKSVRKNELRWIRKYGYEYDVSRDKQHFQDFRLSVPHDKMRL